MAELVFDCIGARAERYSAVPSLTLSLQISETTGQRVDAIALRCQIRIEPQRRRYSEAEAERLHDLFGDTSRWADTLKPLQFTTVSMMVPGFTGSTELDLPVPFTYDLEIASTRYFSLAGRRRDPAAAAVQRDRVRHRRRPASGAAGAVEQGDQLPACRRKVWREAVDAHFPDTAWITMSRDTLDELMRFKTRRALPTWDATLRALLTQAGRDDGSAGVSGDDR